MPFKRKKKAGLKERFWNLFPFAARDMGKYYRIKKRDRNELQRSGPDIPDKGEKPFLH